jgi:hypothetical protein
MGGEGRSEVGKRGGGERRLCKQVYNKYLIAHSGSGSTRPHSALRSVSSIFYFIFSFDRYFHLKLSLHFQVEGHRSLWLVSNALWRPTIDPSSHKRLSLNMEQLIRIYFPSVQLSVFPLPFTLYSLILT